MGDVHAIFSHVGSAAGRELAAWCPGGRLQRRNLLRERSNNMDAAHRLIIDVGSFDGSDAIDFAKFTRRKVLTFEPTPTKHDSIRKRLHEAGVDANVTLLPYALSNTTGTGQLELLRAKHSAGRRFVNNGLGSAQDLLTQSVRPGLLPPTRAGVVSVPVRQLDPLLAERDPLARIAYMKIDAQGFDTLVLRGAEQLLSKTRIETFAFEFTPFLMPGREDEAVSALEWLERLRYSCVPCNQKHTAAFQMSAPSSIRDYVAHYRGTADKYDNMVCQPASRGHST
jgi:FkbM family methyltransferase